MDVSGEMEMLDLMLVGWLAATQSGNPEPTDPARLIAGNWQIVDGESKTGQDCAKGQSFAAAPDGRHIILTERGTPEAEWSVSYLIVRSDKNRLLMSIEGEQRLTENGDPVLWWAYFDGPDKFRWRRYDWKAGEVTAAEWRRCPS